MNLLNYIQFVMIFGLLFFVGLWRHRALQAEEYTRNWKEIAVRNLDRVIELQRQVCQKN